MEKKVFTSIGRLRFLPGFCGAIFWEGLPQPPAAGGNDPVAAAGGDGPAAAAANPSERADLIARKTASSPLSSGLGRLQG